MKSRKRVLIGGLAVVAVAAGAVAASAHRGGFGHHGGAMGHGLMGAVCTGNGAEMADHMLVRIEYTVKPTDAQKPAFDELKAAARAAAAKAKTACPPEPVKAADGTAPRPHKSPVERLAMMESRLSAELEAIRTVRPAAEKFYASLSDDQKMAMTQPEHGRVESGRRGEDRDGEQGGGWHRRHGWENRDGSGPADATPGTTDTK